MLTATLEKRIETDGYGAEGRVSNSTTTGQRREVGKTPAPMERALTMKDDHPGSQRRSFILCIWWEDVPYPHVSPSLRISLEESGEEVRRGFASLDELVTYLQEQVVKRGAV